MEAVFSDRDPGKDSVTVGNIRALVTNVPSLPFMAKLLSSHGSSILLDSSNVGSQPRETTCFCLGHESGRSLMRVVTSHRLVGSLTA